MVTPRQLSATEWLLLTTPDDTEEAPWMVVPEFQWRVVALLMSVLRLYVRRRGLRWHLAAELKITMPRQIIPRSLDLAPDLMVVIRAKAVNLVRMPADTMHIRSIDTDGKRAH